MNLKVLERFLMSDYFLFDDPVEYELLTGLSHKNSLKKINSRKYSKRRENWFNFLNYCKLNKKNLIILISGSSNSGKSSWAIEISKRLGLRNVVHTDTVRNTIRTHNKNDKKSIIHFSSYNCWSKYSKNFTTTSLIKGLKEQSKLMLPYIENIIDEANNNGSFTVIEGIHLIPSILKTNKYKSTFFVKYHLHVDKEKIIKERMIKRTMTNYLNRSPEKYDLQIRQFDTIRNFLKKEALKDQNIKIIENNSAGNTLNIMFDKLFSDISNINS